MKTFWVILTTLIFLMPAYVGAQTNDPCALKTGTVNDGEVLFADRWNQEWQNVYSCASLLVRTGGATMTGNLHMNGADITLTTGRTVDGVDVSVLNDRVQNLVTVVADTTAELNRKVSKAGDTMTGNLSFNDTVCQNTSGGVCLVDGVDVSTLAATVAGSTASLAGKVSKSGDSMTGDLQINNGSDVKFYSNGGTAQTAGIDGATGAASFNGSVYVGAQLAVTGTSTFANDIRLDSQKRFYLDGGNDTYLVQRYENRIYFNTGNVAGYPGSVSFSIGTENNEVMSFTDVALVFLRNIHLNDGRKFFLDGGEDTYITTDAIDNTIKIYTGGTGPNGNLVRAKFDGEGGVSFPGLKVAANVNANVYFNSSTGEIRAVGSSLRYKQDVADIEVDTKKIYDLRPVSFTEIESGNRYMGLIAEEVADVLPELVVYNNDGQPESVAYMTLPVLMLNEMKKMNEKVESLESKVEMLEANILEIKELLSNKKDK